MDEIAPYVFNAFTAAVFILVFAFFVGLSSSVPFVLIASAGFIGYFFAYYRWLNSDSN